MGCDALLDGVVGSGAAVGAPEPDLNRLGERSMLEERQGGSVMMGGVFNLHVVLVSSCWYLRLP